MLPRANRERSRRDIDKLKLAGRSAEIQRLIGRSLRAAVDMEALGERTITIDCDVLQGDGGTRTASVTGGFVGAGACMPEARGAGARWRETPSAALPPASARALWTTRPCSTCSTARTAARRSTSTASVDERGGIIELQGTGEGRAFTPEEQQALVHLCAKGCGELITLQKKALGVGE